MDGGCPGETDIGCGGSLTCPRCADGQKCVAGSDCLDKVCGPETSVSCAAGTCCVATCSDGVTNGVETDTDCGGSNGGQFDSCQRCLVGKACQQGTDCTSGICNNNTCGCPAGMVPVATKIAQGGAFCVDGTEVTKAQYNQFLLANPAPTPATCAWKQTDAGNATYNPGNNWPPTLCPQGGVHEGTEPVQDVDWCDAYNYCSWAGKHLCGHLGPNDTDGGVVFSNDFGAFGDPTQSAWYNACSQQGVSVYPYSGGFNVTNCNGAGGVGAGAVIQDTDCSGNPQLTSCQGGASGLYQMSGNVAEWEDSCNGASAGAAAEGDLCYVRGGSFLSAAGDLECTPGDGGAPPTLARNTQVDSVGFRCCVF